MRVWKLIFYIGTCLLSSCAFTVAHRPFVASSFEPLLANKKGAIQGGLGLRPIKYLDADFTYAATNHLAMRVNSGVTLGLANLSGAMMYYGGLNKLSYFAGGLYNYQSNQIHRDLTNMSGTLFKKYDYSCIYHSPGLVTGFSFTDGQNATHHLILKSQYNFVQSYNYNFQSFNRYEYYVNEQLNYKIPDFLSFEISYACTVPLQKKDCFFKLQVGGHLTQKTLKDHYVYNAIAPYEGGTHYQDAINFHPVSFPLNISIGFIFCSRRD